MGYIRKSTALFLAIAMLSMSILSICAFASTANLRYFERGVLTDGANTAYYVIDKDNRTLYLTGDGVTNARTPDYPNAESGPFAGRTDVTCVTIEENVEYVGDYVFANMTAVDTLEVQSNLISSSSNMSSKAMIGCTALRHIRGESSFLSTDILLQVVKGALNVMSGNWLSLLASGFNIVKSGLSEDSLSNEAIHAMVNDYIMTGEEVFLGDLDEAMMLCLMREQEPCYWDNAYHHDYFSHISRAPSCTEDGETTYTCAVCGSFYIENFGNPLGHNYVYETLYEASCLKEGISKGVCSRCNDIQFVSIPAKGHTSGRWIMTKVPQMGVKGTIQNLCADCGAVIKETDVTMSKSTYYRFKVGVDPENNLAGTLALEYEQTGYASTPIKDGVIMDDNARMGTGCEIYVSYSARATVSDVYTVILYGDVNGDGLIDGKDISILESQVNATDITIADGTVYKRAADMNGDGVIDGFDLALLDLQVSGAKPLDQTRPQY